MAVLISCDSMIGQNCRLLHLQSQVVMRVWVRFRIMAVGHFRPNVVVRCSGCSVLASHNYTGTVQLDW